MIAIDAGYCKGCDICIHVCPTDFLEMSEEVNNRGYRIPRAIEGGRCTNCRQCELLCPDFAIFVVEEDERGEG